MKWLTFCRLTITKESSSGDVMSKARMNDGIATGMNEAKCNEAQKS